MFKRFFSKIKKTERQMMPNTIEHNLQTWTERDWSKMGEEWSNNQEWKKSLVDNVLLPNIPKGCVILEVGPGAGRWTEYLITRASRLYLVDLVEKCIDICRNRFIDCDNIEYFVNNGRNLEMIDTNSIDRIWSWDVFVHIQASDIQSYITEFSRILAPGGRAIIHHSKRGRDDRGWRSDMTAEKMYEFCEADGLKVVSQFDSWDDGATRIWPDLPEADGPDIISIIEKP